MDTSGETHYDDTFYDQQMAGSLASARVVLRTLFDELGPIRSVIDVGCGVAPWLRTAQDFGVSSGLGLDGDYVDRSRLLVEPGCFRPCDLETENLRDAISDKASFDLAMCMEVAEHLSPQRAASFVSELCSLSDLVLFSAAVPDQGGTNHINEQWPGYWSTLFAAAGFECFDFLRPRLWDQDGCEWWYLQNVLVFARRSSGPFAALTPIASTTKTPMSLVHPRNFQQKIGLLNQHIAELSQMVRYQPFGRDEGILGLEAKVDLLRAQALAKANEIEAAAAELAAVKVENDSLRRQTAAIHASTSWRITAPIRQFGRIIQRSRDKAR